ncbi:type I restriction-modification methylase S subunit [Pandoraea pnomenusa]|uniref:Type I restriction-modification methylase S subunit n=2 Tax=Burkholderiaceae TaxID=119060 RepID=A0ABY6WIR9_9BURK|nr:restriction endonuclease subunit S [Pandoraea pnomenusa]HDR8938651.1 restriction endonuclease subunit S [Burkholderia vietnamiensis]VVE65797.1 type I restriction-modification methylase S subunit [Pandoraea pnomenusa]HDR9176937.1 restriction endonuclease subunit S [Burkholderia vietnamiensis]HDR9225504.1 restriction endonuclease subunit S [Burkholderia vietnamiensis]HDR9262921.1 restriction endonuclease subunit S [Burkholderia vietnamiensis]
MSQVHGLVPSKDLGRKSLQSENYAGGKLVAEHDLVLNRLKAHLGVFARAKQAGVVSPDYTVFRPKGDASVRYCESLFKTPMYVGEFRRRTKGIVEGFWRLYTDDFYNVTALLPPPEEQVQIVAYLRAQDAHIARFIKTKRDLIKLLTEQKLRIIDHAVTHGLDSSVALKASGIEWQGEVPEHWEVKPLKRWVRLNARTLGQKTSPDFEFRYVDIGSVQTGRLVKEPERIRFEAAPSRARRVLRRGDTIISTVRTYLKAIWYVSEDADDLIASTGFAVLTPGSGVEPEYLGYVIQSSPFVNRVTANSIGIAYPAIAETVLGRFPVALPPTVDEQQAIVASIKTESAPLDDAIARTEEEIKLIREYRDRLIADVVTGQVDVRGWQPGPDDVVDDAALAALGDENEDVTEEEDGDGED